MQQQLVISVAKIMTALTYTVNRKGHHSFMFCFQGGRLSGNCGLQVCFTYFHSSPSN